MPKPRTPVVIALIAINVVMFGIEIATGADAFSPTPQQLLALGADYGPLTLHGEPWRLFASMFLHFGVIHIGMNMLCLWQGRIVESLYGHVSFAALYLVAGLVGGIASLTRSSAIVSAGASGAVFGVFGAFGAFLMMRRDRLDPKAVSKSARGLAVFIGLNLYIGFTVKGIDLTAHLGGLIAGFLGGVALLAGPNAERQLRARTIGVVIAGIAISVVGLLVIPTSGSDASIAVDRFFKVDSDTSAKRKQLADQLDDKQITQAQFADALDHDIIPSWQAARAAMDDLDVNANARPYVAKLQAYATREEDELRALADVLRQDKAFDEDALKPYTDKAQAAATALHDFEEEAKRLKN